MKVRNIIEALDLQVFGGQEGLDNEVTSGYTSDLLSDVMGNVNEGAAWITLQTHKNVVAIASLRDVSVVIFVKGLLPDAATIEQATAEGIPLLGSELETFELSGKLYKLLASQI